jgi:hypothetical protein
MKKSSEMERTERDLLEEISGKLDQLIAVFATQGQTPDEKIRSLRNAGFDWKFIGAATGLKADAARVRSSRSKNGEA